MRVVPRAGGGVSRSLLLGSSDGGGGGVRELRALDKKLQGLAARQRTGEDVVRSMPAPGPTPPAYIGGIGNSRSSPARVIVMLARAGMMVSEEEVDVVDVTDILDAVDPTDMVDTADVVDPADIVDEVEVADPTDEVDVLDDAVEGGW